jgi:MoaA/NifB/PqqE/SkfB family radical SAM enzyme
MRQDTDKAIPQTQRCRPRVAEEVADISLYDIKVGYACNNRCVHCVIQDYRHALSAQGRADRTTQECLELISNAANANIRAVTITGGEPTIRKDFLTLVDAAREFGLEVQLQTNGRALRSMDLAKAVAARVRLVCVALHGPTASIHDQIAGPKDAFDETISGIRNLVEAGVARIVLKTVVTRVNQGFLKEILEVAATLGLREANVAYMHGEGFPSNRYLSLAARFPALRSEIERCEQFADQAGMNLRYEAIPLCHLPSPWKAIEMNYLQDKDYLFSMVGEQPRLWNQLRRAAKAKGSRCSTCSLDELCEGAWEEYVRHFGDEDLVPKETKDMADLLFGAVTSNKEHTAGGRV